MNRSLGAVLIVLGSLFAAFLTAWLYLHSKAESKPVKTPFEHAFLQAAHSGGQKLLILRAQTPADAAKLEKSDEKYSTALWLDVRLGGESQLVVSQSETIQNGPVKGKPVEIASTEECRAAGLYDLTDFFRIAKDRLVILNLISRRPGLSNRILEVWGDEKPLSVAKVLMQSEGDGTLKELRDAEPRGLYGSSQSTLIQLEILSTIGLDGLMDLKADVLVSALEEFLDGATVPRLRVATLREAHRRGLKRYAGPTRTKESAQELLNAGYDGVLFEQREVLDSVRH
ncbi:hypothetical protein BH10BDE1_BH10BDE1_20690 [soil metagenome]